MTVDRRDAADDTVADNTVAGASHDGTPPPPVRRRRQWGAERPRPPLPPISPRASVSATWMGGLALVATVVTYLAYLAFTVVAQLIDKGLQDSRYVGQTVLYVILMAFLILSSFLYLLARQGALFRSRTHVRVPRAEIDSFMADTRPSLTVLVPSYREDPEVVRSTLLSAALQEYPGLRIVLLLDDPPNPTDPAAVADLAGCRALPGELTRLLAAPHERFSTSLVDHEAAELAGGASTAEQVRALALDFRWAATWLRDQQRLHVRASNADDFVADEVLGALAGDFEVTAGALFAALDHAAPVPAARLAQLCRRLVWTFEADITSFERKAYLNLPHDANKAMNLNAYIALMGRTVRSIDTEVGRVLRDGDGPDAHLVPDSDYLLTLDADSVLLREYCLRLVFHLEQPGNERIAVAQTPYSGFRGAATRLERIAAATTDIQHVVHQGLTYYDATFWVGANAVIRKIALDDIVETSYVGGEEVRRYVQDRTVIEDTESSIDLIAHGWSLDNYPERLSYSATPPDFGSLVVQRARWANGGLIIAPKFWRFARQERKAGRRLRRSTVALRLNYMMSIAWASFGLLFLLVFPFDDRLLSPIIVAAAIPYFLAMAHDFHRLGYKRTDIFRVYAFNLVLLPVNLAGTLTSLQQAASNSKIAFARTPKVADRTAAPALYVLAAYAIAAFSFYTLAGDLVAGRWSHAVFAGFNGVLTSYAIVAFMGLRNSLVDIWVGMLHWVRVPATPRRSRRSRAAAAAEPAQPDWQDVLYYGPDHTASEASTRVAVSTVPPVRRGDTRARQRG